MLSLKSVKIGTILTDNALSITHNNIFNARSFKHIANTNSSRTSAIHNYLKRRELTTGEISVVNYARERNYSRSPLIIVKYGNIELTIESIFNLEACGRGNIFEINAAILRSERLNHLDNALRIGLTLISATLTATIKRHGPRIDITKRLKKNSLTFHNRNRR